MTDSAEDEDSRYTRWSGTFTITRHSCGVGRTKRVGARWQGCEYIEEVWTDMRTIYVKIGRTGAFQ